MPNNERILIGRERKKAGKKVIQGSVNFTIVKVKGILFGSISRILAIIFPKSIIGDI